MSVSVTLRSTWTTASDPDQSPTTPRASSAAERGNRRRHQRDEHDQRTAAPGGEPGGRCPTSACSMSRLPAAAAGRRNHQPTREDQNQVECSPASRSRKSPRPPAWARRSPPPVHIPRSYFVRVVKQERTRQRNPQRPRAGRRRDQERFKTEMDSIRRRVKAASASDNEQAVTVSMYTDSPADGAGWRAGVGAARLLDASVAHGRRRTRSEIALGGARGRQPVHGVDDGPQGQPAPRRRRRWRCRRCPCRCSTPRSAGRRSQRGQDDARREWSSTTTPSAPSRWSTRSPAWSKKTPTPPRDW